MSETRKLIRNTMVDLLKGSTDVEEKVFASRSTPTQRESLPVINVYTLGESVADNGEAPLLNNRSIDLICEIIVSSPDDSEASDMADDIAEQVEQVLFKQDADANGKLGCLVDSIRLQSVTCDYDSTGESTINTCRLGFSVTYHKEAVTTEAENTTDLDRMGVDWDVGTANDPDPEASDIIELDP